MPTSGPLVGQQPCGDGGGPGCALLVGHVGSRCCGKTSSRRTTAAARPGPAATASTATSRASAAIAPSWCPAGHRDDPLHRAPGHRRDDAPAPDHRRAKLGSCVAPASGPWPDLAPCSSGHAWRLRSAPVPASGVGAARQARAAQDPSPAWPDPYAGGREPDPGAGDLRVASSHRASRSCRCRGSRAPSSRTSAPAPRRMAGVEQRERGEEGEIVFFTGYLTVHGTQQSMKVNSVSNREGKNE